MPLIQWILQNNLVPYYQATGTIRVSGGFTYDVHGLFSVDASGLVTITGQFGTAFKARFYHAAEGSLRLSGATTVHRTVNLGPRKAFRFRRGDRVYDFLLRALTVVGTKFLLGQTFYTVNDGETEFDLPDGFLYGENELRTGSLACNYQSYVDRLARLDVVPSADPASGSQTFSLPDDFTLADLVAARTEIANRIAALSVTPLSDPSSGMHTFSSPEDGLAALVAARTEIATRIAALSVTPLSDPPGGNAVFGQRDDVDLDSVRLLYADKLARLDVVPSADPASGMQTFSLPDDTRMAALTKARIEIANRIAALSVTPLSNNGGDAVFAIADPREAELERLLKVKTRVAEMLARVQGG